MLYFSLMKNINFRLVFVVMFGFVGIFAFLVFAGYLPFPSFSSGGDTDIAGEVNIWGSVPSQTIKPYLEDLQTDKLRVIYSEIATGDLETGLINALATNSGPDIILWSHEGILRHADKMLLIPYETISQEMFSKTFVRSADIFVLDEGILALPIMTDPLLFFINNRISASSFVTKNPENWQEVQESAQSMTRLASTGEILQSGLAFGTSNNIPNIKTIISGLFFQQGIRIVDPRTRQTDLLDGNNSQLAADALSFFSAFSDPNLESYTWNTSLPNATDMFVSGKLGMYIDHASAITNILNKNPNLDFSVDILPQPTGALDRVTAGQLYALALTKDSTRNIDAASHIFLQLAYSDGILELAKNLSLAPARLSSLSTSGSNSFLETLYKSALIMQTWLDPDPATTDRFFEQMVRAVNSNAQDPENAINVLQQNISRMFIQI